MKNIETKDETPGLFISFHFSFFIFHYSLAPTLS